MLIRCKNHHETFKLAQKKAGVSVFIRIFLALLKGIAGLLTNSAGLISDALNSCMDILSTITVYLGIWVSQKEHPDFPYGLYKAETLATLVVSLVIISAAFGIMFTAFTGKIGGEIDTSLAIKASALSLVITVSFGIYQLKNAKKVNSPAIEADAKDYLADGFASFVVLTGLIGTSMGFNIDKWAAVLVGFYILWSGVSILIKSIKDLLDASIDKEMESEIIELVNSHPNIRGIIRCMTRTSGARYIVDIDVELSIDSHQEADMIADEIEEEIMKKFPFVAIARIRAHCVENSI